jgi:DNA repair protein RadC
MKLPQTKITVKTKKGDGITYQMKTSADAAQFFRTIFNADTIQWTEESAMITLNRANEVISVDKLSSGGTAGVILDSRVVFTIALKLTGHSIILAHNHPSGNLKPSNEDIKVTRELRSGGDILGIRVLDHIILSDSGYLSMADEGYI